MYLNIKKDSSAYYTLAELQPKISELQNFSSELQNNLSNIMYTVLSKQIPHVGYSIYPDTNSSPILNSIGMPNRNCNHFVMDFSSAKPLKIDRAVFVINPDLDLPRLIKNSSLQKTLVIFLSKKPFPVSHIHSSVTKLKQALKARESSNYYLKMKIPIDFNEFDNLISIITTIST